MVPAGTSVLDDLGLDPGFVMESKLAIRIARTVHELGLTQRDAAERMGISQAELSQLTRGKFDGLSEAKLADCLAALGHDVTIGIGPRHDGIGIRQVLETT